MERLYPAEFPKLDSLPAGWEHDIRYVAKSLIGHARRSKWKAAFRRKGIMETNRAHATLEFAYEWAAKTLAETGLAPEKHHGIVAHMAYGLADMIASSCLAISCHDKFRMRAAHLERIYRKELPRLAAGRDPMRLP